MVEIAGFYDEDAEPSQSFDPIPAGKYRAVIVESGIEDISKTSDNGKCVVMTWKIQGGDYDGRFVWQRLNMWADNMNNLEKVRFIANQQFAAIREATGVKTPRNTDELHDRPCDITVKIKTDPNGQYAPRNEISGVSAAGGSSAAPRQSSAPPKQAASSGPGPGKSSAPWSKRA